MNYFDEILYLSQRLLKYESVYGHGGFTSKAIFGKSIALCLQDALDYCEAIGMETYLDAEGMYGYAQFGKGNDYIAILTHLDVVPPGDLSHWEHPPFDPLIIEDKLLARGAADDKVPAAIAILSVKKLMDDQVLMKYPIRIIFGGDEETGFRCIEKYKTCHQPPKYTLVMDGTFPFSYSEKHLLNYELTVESSINIQGGESYNSVMDFVAWEKENEILKISGKSAHASRPTRGENALVKLAYMNPQGDLLFQVVNSLLEPNGEHKLTCIDSSYDVTLSIGMVKNNKFYVDLRVPPEVVLEQFVKDFEEEMRQKGVETKQTDLLKGTITDLQSHFSKTVLRCYQEITGDYETKPFKTGSATYGRSFENNCLAFGPRMNYHITNTHKPNEFISYDLIENAFEIYVHTLKTIEEEL
ncbi:MAG: M20/M25/M40 family metallo-hydrolase [Clostridia bacterium]|nr:M20/M25/M40 family metallo-hydrolase [Clostridia bacterium]